MGFGYFGNYGVSDEVGLGFGIGTGYGPAGNLNMSESLPVAAEEGLPATAIALNRMYFPTSFLNTFNYNETGIGAGWGDFPEAGMAGMFGGGYGAAGFGGAGLGLGGFGLGGLGGFGLGLGPFTGAESYGANLGTGFGFNSPFRGIDGTGAINHSAY